MFSYFQGLIFRKCFCKLIILSYMYDLFSHTHEGFIRNYQTLGLSIIWRMSTIPARIPDTMQRGALRLYEEWQKSVAQVELLKQDAIVPPAFLSAIQTPATQHREL